MPWHKKVAHNESPARLLKLFSESNNRSQSKKVHITMPWKALQTQHSAIYNWQGYRSGYGEGRQQLDNCIRIFLVYLVGPSWASKWLSIHMESTFMFLLMISPKFGQFFQSLPKNVIACYLPDCVSAVHTRWCSPIEPSIMIFLNCLSLCFNVQNSFLSRPIVDGGCRDFFCPHL